MKITAAAPLIAVNVSFELLPRLKSCRSSSKETSIIARTGFQTGQKFEIHRCRSRGTVPSAPFPQSTDRRLLSVAFVRLHAVVELKYIPFRYRNTRFALCKVSGGGIRLEGDLDWDRRSIVDWEIDATLANVSTFAANININIAYK